jgi:hypothetical protein
VNIEPEPSRDLLGPVGATVLISQLVPLELDFVIGRSQQAPRIISEKQMALVVVLVLSRALIVEMAVVRFLLNSLTWLDGEIFYTLLEAQAIIERWHCVDNTLRPRSSLGYRRHPARCNG